MYAWIWHKLPFGRPGKITGSLLLVTAVGSLLWFVVFPWAEPLLPFDDVQVTQDVQDPGGQVDGNVNGDDPGLDDDIPYPTDRNNPAPTPSR
jgi:hypothetical protein